MAGTRKGDVDVGYETKVILKAIIAILDNAKDLEEAKQTIIDMANVEEVIAHKKEEK